MPKFISRFILSCLLTTLMVSIASHADAATFNPITKSADKTSASPTGPTFDFTVKTDCDHCIYWGDYSAAADFPKVNDKVATKVRLYYSATSFQDVTQVSPYIELPILTDPSSGSVMLPDVRMGNIPPGRKFYFKAGLADATGAPLWFSGPGDVNETKNTGTTR